ERRLPHPIENVREPRELVPTGHERNDFGIGHGFAHRSGKRDISKVVVVVRTCDWIVSRHASALCFEPADERKGRRLTYIVGIGLERDAEYRNPPPANRGEVACDETHHLVHLAAIDLEDALQQREIKPLLAALADECCHIFRKAAAAESAAGLEEARNSRGDALPTAPSREVAGEMHA